jgi:hypothetical protein
VKDKQNMQYLIPNGKLYAILIIIFTLGLVTAVVLTFAALLALGYLVNVLLDACLELASHLAATYAEADSLGRILFLGIIVYLMVHIAPLLARSARRAWRIA